MATAPPNVPSGNPDTQPFWDGCQREELLLQRCAVCEAYRHPAGPVCSRCLSDRYAWVRATGRGTVYTFTVIRQALAQGWSERVPYVVAVVELDEGPRFLTNLVNVIPDDVTIGMPVEVTFGRTGGATNLPLFQPLARPA